jgi:hypothetical protein
VDGLLELDLPVAGGAPGPHLATAVRSGFFAAPYIEGDPFTVSIHGGEGFRALVEEARARHLAFAALAAGGPGPGGHGVPAGRP